MLEWGPRAAVITSRAALEYIPGRFSQSGSQLVGIQQSGLFVEKRWGEGHRSLFKVGIWGIFTKAPKLDVFRDPWCLGTAEMHSKTCLEVSKDPGSVFPPVLNWDWESTAGKWQAEVLLHGGRVVGRQMLMWWFWMMGVWRELFLMLYLSFSQDGKICHAWGKQATVYFEHVLWKWRLKVNHHVQTTWELVDSDIQWFPCNRCQFTPLCVNTVLPYGKLCHNTTFLRVSPCLLMFSLILYIDADLCFSWSVPTVLEEEHPVLFT